LCFFLGWTLVIRPGNEPPPVDLGLAESMQEFDDAHPLLRDVFIFFTRVGGILSLIALGAIATLGALALGQWRLAVIWVVAVAGGAGLNLALKAGIDRHRPPRPDSFVTEHNESYPSGHAMGSTIGFGMIAYAGLLVVRRRLWRIALVAGTIVVVSLVGASRIFLRAHWFSDVIAGFLIGGAWLALCLSALEWWQRRSAHSG